MRCILRAMGHSDDIDSFNVQLAAKQNLNSSESRESESDNPETDVPFDRFAWQEYSDQRQQQIARLEKVERWQKSTLLANIEG